jgi:uncharacterized protein (DUF488 family)
VSAHSAWTVAAFRSYADYADTEPFRDALNGLIERAAERRSAIMCAEALYWQCHRRLIADQLLVRGIEVLHIQSPTRTVAHVLPEFARLSDGRIIYDRGSQLALT